MSLSLNFTEQEKKDFLCDNGFKVGYSRGSQVYKKNGKSYSMEDAFWITVKDTILQGGGDTTVITEETVRNIVATGYPTGHVHPFTDTDLTLMLSGGDAVPSEDIQTIDGGNSCHVF
jgi:hypothetical protein